MSFVDVEIHIQKQEPDQRYPVDITVDGLRRFPRGYLIKTDKTPAPRTDANYTDQTYGQELFEWLFTNEQLRENWAEIRGLSRTRRIRLFIDHGDPELAKLHTWTWEALCEPPTNEQPAHQVAANPDTPFSRFLAVSAALLRPLVRRPIRMLVVAPQQDNFAEKYPASVYPNMARIDSEEEWKRLKAHLQPLIAQGQLDLDPPLERCSLAAIANALSQARAENRGYHILHLIAHGDYREGQASLLLADQVNRVQREIDQDIATQLCPAVHDDDNGLRLIFLASCASAKRAPADAFRGLAPKLVAAGVPAVIAMQDWVDEETVRAFAATFYAQLLRHGQVDLAANEARQVVKDARLPGAVSPVLFLRLKDGKLIEPDPDLAALCHVLAQLKADNTYAMVADDRGHYLQLPVEALSISKEQPLWQALRVNRDPTAGILFEDAVIHKLCEPSTRLILVVGDYGSNVTTQLKRVAWGATQRIFAYLNSTIDESAKVPEPDPSARFLPLFATLDELRHGKAKYPAAPVIGVVLHKLNNSSPSAPVWPTLTAERLKQVLEKFELTLLLILDDDDALTEREQRDYYALIADTKSCITPGGKVPLKVVLAVRPEAFEGEGVFSKQRFDVLALQPMERAKVRHFLGVEAKENTWTETLLAQIDQSVYYDLVAIPWFLIKVIEQARNGFCPGSRSEIIATIIDHAINRVVQDIAEREQDNYLLRPSRQGLEGNIRQIIYDLAWQMQFAYTDSLPLVETLTTIERHRSYRSYGVESMYEALVAHKLLARKGSDRVRFAYQSIQSYCCAQAILKHPNSKQVLDDIMAGLGRLPRLRWWEQTLVCTCGLMTSTPTLLAHFLEVIVYGMEPLNNEQLFLAARCVVESIQAYRMIQQRANGKQELPSQMAAMSEDLAKMTAVIARALTWRLDSRYEPRSAERRRAAELLGQIVYPPTTTNVSEPTTERVSKLVQIAYGKPRHDRHHKPSFDHSDVRMAAVIGLLRLPSNDCPNQVLNAIDKKGVLAAMLKQWLSGDVTELIKTFSNNTDIAAQSIAAMALGDLWGRLSLSASQEDKKNARDALRELKDKFKETDTHEETMWAVAYALAMIDLPTVKRALVTNNLWMKGDQEGSTALPTDEELTDFFGRWQQQAKRHKFLAYLIGLSRWRDQQSLAFLREPCLKQNEGQVSAAAVAIEALSLVGSPLEDVDLLKNIALGKWKTIPGLKQVRASDHKYMQRKAIDALADLGDDAAVDKLRQHIMCSSKWTPELERALFITSEKIFWRTNKTIEP